MPALAQLTLEDALADANDRISSFLKGEKTALDPIFQALDEVSYFLPVHDPTPEESIFLAEYRTNLENLYCALQRGLLSRETAMQAQRGRLVAALAYGQARQI